jgi:hypothetical protein
VCEHDEGAVNIAPWQAKQVFEICVVDPPFMYWGVENKTHTDALNYSDAMTYYLLEQRR